MNEKLSSTHECRQQGRIMYCCQLTTIFITDPLVIYHWAAPEASPLQLWRRWDIRSSGRDLTATQREGSHQLALPATISFISFLPWSCVTVMAPQGCLMHFRACMEFERQHWEYPMHVCRCRRLSKVICDARKIVPEVDTVKFIHIYLVISDIWYLSL